MIDAVFRPLQTWPGPRTPEWERQRSPFSASYTDTLDLLERELRHLEARNVVVQVVLEPSQIRNGGLPKTINAIKDPAVIVTFSNAAGEEFAYPCDTFSTYVSNIRAIALALEALRKVDRYGVTRKGEQYQGFRALPAAEEPQPRMSAEAAAEFVGELTGIAAASILSDPELFKMASKLAARRAHPDRKDTGSHDRFVRLQEAMAAIEKHSKSKAAAGGR